MFKNVYRISYQKSFISLQLDIYLIIYLIWMCDSWQVLKCLLLDPLSWLEGSYELGFIRLSVLLPFRPFVRKFSWNQFISFFLKVTMVLEAHVVLCMTELEFWKRIFLLPKWGKWAKTGIFEFIGKFVHYFFLNLVYKESLY